MKQSIQWIFSGISLCYLATISPTQAQTIPLDQVRDLVNSTLTTEKITRYRLYPFVNDRGSPWKFLNTTAWLEPKCSASSLFIITGRGGLPPNPRTEPLSGDAVQVDWVSLKPRGENRVSTNVSQKATSPTPAPIVEAQGWVRNAKGEVVLTAYAPIATPHSSWLTAASCP